MKIRNSYNTTMTEVVITILLIMGIFFGSFAYFLFNTEDSSQSLDPKYSDMRDNLTVYRVQVEKKTQDVRDNLDDMKQSESALAQVWNGIKGLGNTILLTIQFIPATIGTYESIVPGLDFIPAWAYPLIYTGILVFIVFLIVKITKGEPNM